MLCSRLARRCKGHACKGKAPSLKPKKWMLGTFEWPGDGCTRALLQQSGLVRGGEAVPALGTPRGMLGILPILFFYLSPAVEVYLLPVTSLLLTSM
jgi:hypothetical protein